MMGSFGAVIKCVLQFFKNSISWNESVMRKNELFLCQIMDGRLKSFPDMKCHKLHAQYEKLYDCK